MQKPTAIAAAVFSLALWNPAMAQESREGPISVNGATEQVIVTPLHRGWSPYGAPEMVTMHKTVQYHDLNLPTVASNIAFRHRISEAAYSTCTRLSLRYPTGGPNRETCYRTAMDRATPLVDTIIHTHPVSDFNALP
jgi:UrcA family protein